ncbi:GIY-YIG nuclease family protein [Rhodococcus ruber]|uniref:GIY-YIG nuclease family protein n=1 Tax=Rhodococcus ruber TaxID=1830 RepID=UPI001F269287|nr:GIY-YIG nuclease family protein [Rhodococcus ruber]MCF8783225.1 GIY-YIG nuclease family protein [Rhodococcus ruber]
MKQWYAYVIDRSFERYGYTSHETVFAEIYEAASKDEVKQLVLEDVGYMSAVRMRNSDRIPQYERFITNIYELNDSWREIWLHKHSCKQCRHEYTKIEKKKFGTGGRTEFCSSECQKEYEFKFAPVDVTTYDTATVYMITHKPTGLRYVGVTVRWLMQRWWEHIKADSGSPFHQFVKGHDLTEFTFEVLEMFKPSEVDPFEREAHYIAKLDTVQNGLNTLNGKKAA